MCQSNYNDIRSKLRKEARERIAKRKLEEGKCLDLDDIAYLSKEERIKLAKFMCDNEFK